MKNFDVAIIGAGPAGLFATHCILKYSKQATILLIDMGKAAQDRKCCGNCQICGEKERCSVLCGVGGGGLFSDGKLILDLHAGGKLDAVANLNEDKREELITTIVETLKHYDGQSEPSPNITADKQDRWRRLCSAEGLEIKHYDVLHMGTENLNHITTRFATAICENPRVSLKLNCEIVRLENDPHNRSILCSSNGEFFSAENVIFSVGKTGSNWLRSLFSENKIHFRKENTYVGIRLEVPHKAIDELLEYSFDPKIWTYYGERKVKTHCFCRHGDVVCTNYMGFSVVGGHTRFTAKNNVTFGNQSLRGNFNILASTKHTEKDIYQALEQFRQINPNGVVVQKLSDFLYSNNSGTLENAAIMAHMTQCKTGNIRKILDNFDTVGTTITDFILRLSRIVPGILDDNSLVYAPALEWFMDSVEVDSNMETSHKGWFAVGDGAGLSQGVVHSAATSIIAAEEICRRMKK